MKKEWLFPRAVIPVDVETTAALVTEIKRLIDVVGGMSGDHNMNQTPTFHLELNDDAVAMLDSMRQKIRALEQACEFYDAALKASWPDGAKGEVFYNWNEARYLTGRSYIGVKK